MIKVLIADDEELFREGMALDVEWEENDLFLCGLAADGEEALRLVAENMPDIVVTDIRMPYIDGLEFIEKAKEINSHIQFIIISGHDEFEYAQKAVKLGVCDFLLKPLEDGELQKLLLERKSEILKTRKIIQVKNIRDSFLRIHTQPDIEKCNLHLIIVVKYDDYSNIEGSPPDFYSTIENISLDFPEASLIESRNGTAIICLSSTEIETMKQKLAVFIRTLRTNETLKNVYSYSIGVGNTYMGVDKLNQSYDEAKSALNQKFLEGKNKTFFYNKIQTDNQLLQSQSKAELDYSDLLQDLRTGDTKAIDQHLSRLIKTTTLMGKDSFAYGLMIVGNIFTEALKILEDSGGSSNSVFENPMAAYERISSQQTMEEMFQQLKQGLVIIQDHIKLLSSGGNELLLKNIKAYILKNFNNPDLTLGMTADNFNISQGYLCSIFNRGSDLTFKEFLTKNRINMACDLILSSDYMIYEIAHKVGYNNPTYFNSVFKKTTGMSPGAYKKEHNSNEY